MPRRVPGGIVRVPSEERRRFELEARSRSCLAGIEDDDFGSINWDPLLEEALRAKAGLSVFMDSASCGWDQAPATSPVAMLDKRKAGAQTRGTASPPRVCAEPRASETVCPRADLPRAEKRSTVAARAVSISPPPNLPNVLAIVYSPQPSLPPSDVAPRVHHDALPAASIIKKTEHRPEKDASAAPLGEDKDMSSNVFGPDDLDRNANGSGIIRHACNESLRPSHEFYGNCNLSIQARTEADHANEMANHSPSDVYSRRRGGDGDTNCEINAVTVPKQLASRSVAGEHAKVVATLLQQSQKRHLQQHAFELPFRCMRLSEPDVDSSDPFPQGSEAKRSVPILGATSSGACIKQQKPDAEGAPAARQTMRKGIGGAGQNRQQAHQRISQRYGLSREQEHAIAGNKKFEMQDKARQEAKRSCLFKVNRINFAGKATGEKSPGLETNPRIQSSLQSDTPQVTRIQPVMPDVVCSLPVLSQHASLHRQSVTTTSKTGGRQSGCRAPSESRSPLMETIDTRWIEDDLRDDENDLRAIFSAEEDESSEGDEDLPDTLQRERVEIEFRGKNDEFSRSSSRSLSPTAGRHGRRSDPIDVGTYRRSSGFCRSTWLPAGGISPGQRSTIMQSSLSTPEYSPRKLHRARVQMLLSKHPACEKLAPCL